MRGFVVVAILVGAGGSEAAPMWKVPPVAAVHDVTATSTLADKRDAYAATRVLEYDYRVQMGIEPVLYSAWCEGKKDAGVGEGVTIRFAEPTPVDALRIAAGVWRTTALFKANNQPTELEVIVDGGKPAIVRPRGRSWLEVKLGVKATTIAVKIHAVKAGKMNDSCIAGIDLMRGGERIVPMLGADPKSASTLEAGVDEIQAALTRPDHKGLEKLLEFPFSYQNVEQFSGRAGAEDTVVDATIKELLAACTELAKQPQDADATKTGCPQPVWVREGANIMTYADAVTVVSPVSLEIAWPSGREVQVVWHLHYSDRWRLTSATYR